MAWCVTRNENNLPAARSNQRPMLGIKPVKLTLCRAADVRSGAVVAVVHHLGVNQPDRLSDPFQGGDVPSDMGPWSVGGLHGCCAELLPDPTDAPAAALPIVV